MRPEHEYRIDICLGCARQTYDDGTPCTCGEFDSTTIGVVSADAYRAIEARHKAMRLLWQEQRDKAERLEAAVIAALARAQAGHPVSSILQRALAQSGTQSAHESGDSAA